MLDVGIPKNESTVDQMNRQSCYNQIINDITEKFEITHAMFCDSMFHLIKNTNAPVVKDGTELPQLEDIPTMEAFIPHYLRRGHEERAHAGHPQCQDAKNQRS